MTLPQDLGARLASRYGLDPKLCSGPGLEHALQAVRERHGLDSMEACFDELRLSEKAFSEFADSLLIPESWFFRDRAPFLFLTEWVNNTWLPANPSGKLKMLSLPCATGQEPYSLAIALLEAGLEPQRFQIVAGDLSPRLIEQARKACYRSLAFRGKEFCEPGAYFEHCGENDIRVREHVRALVEFSTMNLLQPDSFAKKGPFDIICCRNVLIYFDDRARRTVIEILDSSLAENGILCVGHADGIGRITEGFCRIGPPGAFCYQRKPAYVESPRPKPLPKKTKAARRSVLPKKKPKPKPQLLKPTDNGLLSRANELADSGKLSEAEQLCRKQLSEEPSSVEALYLLGQVLLAQKKVPDGEAQLRRVVYLEPSHADALFHLALLAEQRGDMREAANWKRRAAKRKLQSMNN